MSEWPLTSGPEWDEARDHLRQSLGRSCRDERGNLVLVGGPCLGRTPSVQRAMMLHQRLQELRGSFLVLQDPGKRRG